MVSDHGFAAVEHDVNLYAAFLNAGLFSVDDKRRISAWKAMPWPAGGNAAIMLADPADIATRGKVSTLLKQLADDPDSGVERILDHEELARRGGFPGAEFLVAFRLGYEFGEAYDGPLVSRPTNLGTHGYLSDHPEMRSSFFIVGPRITAGPRKHRLLPAGRPGPRWVHHVNLD